MTRDEIVDLIEEMGLEEDLVLFDGMESAFLGVAERFEPVIATNELGETMERGGAHRYFAVYSYAKMVDVLMADGELGDEEAQEYLEFNTVGLYAGPNTPAIMRDW